MVDMVLLQTRRGHLCGSSSLNFYVHSDYRFDFGCWFGSQDWYTFVLSIASLTEFCSQHPFVLAIVLAHKAFIRSPWLLPRTHRTCSILQSPWRAQGGYLKPRIGEYSRCCYFQHSLSTREVFSATPSMPLKRAKLFKGKGLVRISATCISVATYGSFMTPFWTMSLI